MFGRKAARIAELERANANLNRRLGEWEDQWKERKTFADKQNEKLIRDIREMDQLVYQMAQAGYPEQMRSAIQRAWAITEPRMQAESRRIESVLIPEIKKAYLP